MLKLLKGLSGSSLKQPSFRTSIFRVASYSTQTRSTPSDSLYRRLQICHEQRASLTPVLDKWIVEGQPVDYEQLKSYIIKFRKIGRFKSALEISTWISEMKCFDAKPGHIGIHLDLISKVRGLKQAEHYFNSLDKSLLVYPVYGALLNCYADTKALEKAEAVMDKIRDLNSRSNLDYNTMLSLYSRTNNHAKLQSLIQEMENKGIVFDEFTYNIRLNAYATSCNIAKMEMLVMKMEADPEVTISSITYITAAKGYLKAGLREKALSALKKAELLIRNHERQTTYGVLITVYAAMREKENVYRLWDLLLKKVGGKTYYRNYSCMLTSLEKLDDLEGVGKIYSEWEEKNNNKNNNSNSSYFDIRISNLVISAYCKKGLVREAEGVLGRVLGNGKEATASTWSHMALGYCVNSEMEKAVEMTKKAFRASFPEWKPDVKTVAACLEYLKKEGDGNGIREILMLLEKCGKFSTWFNERVERYACNDKVRDEALEDGV
ncbi:hypothetical protein CASFOL_039873 [Castilleja foliolosa]|uniref:Pentatricopeptide repeat-containing protein n=1 Tax=Castilleja foliolosa TaxID=1961234 RepID=A0ABD3BGG1_9LAMI